MISDILNDSNFQIGWVTINSFIAAISLVFSIKAFKRNKKVTEKTLNKKFFDDIFSDYMIKSIPEQLLKIESDRDMLSDNCKEFNKLINEILDKSIFYKFFELEFYGKISDILIKLDEELVRVPQDVGNNEKLTRHKEKINKLANDLYREMKRYYSEI